MSNKQNKRTVFKDAALADGVGEFGGKYGNQYDVIVDDGVIESIIPFDPVPEISLEKRYGKGAKVIDCNGLALMPGLIDLHVHFRDPGFTQKEDIRSGSRAAAAGGFTTVVCMPNTDPAIDSKKALLDVDRKGREAGYVNLLVAPAMSKGQKGKKLTDLQMLAEAKTRCSELTGRGIAAVSEDGRSLMDDALMRQVSESAASLGLPVFDHAEDASLSGGVMNEGAVSRRLAVRGIPARAEENIIERDIKLARETGAKFLIQHVSTERGAALIAKAKRELGEDAFCGETCPHYFILTEEAVADKLSLAKMNPPLRTEGDRRAVLSAILKKQGGLDVVSTDHAPHTKKEKSKPLAEAPFGIVGLETSFPLSLTWLHIYCGMGLSALSWKMSGRPAQILGMKDRGRMKEGFVADLALFDLNTTFEIDSSTFFSKGKNTPFDGLQVKGKTVLTMLGGKATFKNKEYMGRWHP